MNHVYTNKQKRVLHRQFNIKYTGIVKSNTTTFNEGNEKKEKKKKTFIK